MKLKRKRMAAWAAASVLALGLLQAACDKPDAKAEDPRSPDLPRSLAQPAKKSPYLSHEEMTKIYHFISESYKEAKTRQGRAVKLRDAKDPNWEVEWRSWAPFQENVNVGIGYRRTLYRLETYQNIAGHPILCLDPALSYLGAVVNALGRNIGQFRPMEPGIEEQLQQQLDACKEQLDHWTPPEEFSGAPPREIK